MWMILLYLGARLRWYMTLNLISVHVFIWRISVFLTYFLSIEVAHGTFGIYQCQRKYAFDIIVEIGILYAFSLEQNHLLSLATDEPLSKPSRYQILVCRRIYLGVSCLNLSFVIHVLSQSMNSIKFDWKTTLPMVCYLKSNPHKVILFRSNYELTLFAWCESNWIGFSYTLYFIGF